MNIRPLTSADVADLERVLEETDLFPAEMLSEMTAGYLSDPSRDEIWLVCERDGKAIGFCYAMPEQLADGTWNLVALAVLPSTQGAGVGGAIVSTLESLLRDAGRRVLIVETSSGERFRRTRAFYDKCGYEQEARIRDFWAEGDDKVIYRKKL